MARKKYIRDYRLIESVGRAGRLRTDYEYIGARYVYVLGPETVSREKRRVLILTAAGWLWYLGALAPNAAGMHRVYIALPFLMTAIPLGILTDVVLSAIPKKEPLRRQQADMLENRYPPAALFAAALPCVSLLGELVTLLRGEELSPGDAVFSICAALLALCGALTFSRRECFRSREDGGEE